MRPHIWNKTVYSLSPPRGHLEEWTRRWELALFDYLSLSLSNTCLSLLSAEDSIIGCLEREYVHAESDWRQQYRTIMYLQDI